MRASRLLLLLLLLQNRGRMTSEQLAAELEVSTRTVLRDLEALSEAGLPVVVHRGRTGGVELGFSFRTRLTGLAADEAEALGVLLGRDSPELAVLGLAEAGARARLKVVESLPDQGRRLARDGGERFRLVGVRPQPDPRVAALADAVRESRVVRLRARDGDPQTVHPVGLTFVDGCWLLVDALAPEDPVPDTRWGTVNVSARRFATDP